MKVHEDRFQHQFSLNVWIGIAGDWLNGPVFLPTRINSEIYLNFSSEFCNFLTNTNSVIRKYALISSFHVTVHFPKYIEYWQTQSDMHLILQPPLIIFDIINIVSLSEPDSE